MLPTIQWFRLIQSIPSPKAAPFNLLLAHADMGEGKISKRLKEVFQFLAQAKPAK